MISNSKFAHLIFINCLNLAGNEWWWFVFCSMLSNKHEACLLAILKLPTNEKLNAIPTMKFKVFPIYLRIFWGEICGSGIGTMSNTKISEMENERILDGKFAQIFHMMYIYKTHFKCFTINSFHIRSTHKKNHPHSQRENDLCIYWIVLAISVFISRIFLLCHVQYLLLWFCDFLYHFPCFSLLFRYELQKLERSHTHTHISKHKYKLFRRVYFSHFVLYFLVIVVISLSFIGYLFVFFPMIFYWHSSYILTICIYYCSCHTRTCTTNA